MNHRFKIGTKIKVKGSDIWSGKVIDLKYGRYVINIDDVTGNPYTCNYDELELR